MTFLELRTMFQDLRRKLDDNGLEHEKWVSVGLSDNLYEVLYEGIGSLVRQNIVRYVGLELCGIKIQRTDKEYAVPMICFYGGQWYPLRDFLESEPAHDR